MERNQMSIRSERYYDEKMAVKGVDYEQFGDDIYMKAGRYFGISSTLIPG